MSSKTIFVTGTTGHYGAAFAIAATQRHPAARFVALVRAHDEAHARLRLAAKWERLVGRDTALRLLDRWHVIPGELSRLPALDDGVLDDATHVVHFAANTSFVEKKTVWRTNLEGALALATRYSTVRQTFGKPICEHQAIQLKIGEMATRARAARLLTLDAADAFDRGERCDLQAGMAKYFSSEAALENSIESMRIHGAYGYSKEYDIERLYRDAPLTCIGEGTNEMQRIIIARQWIKRHAEL